MTGIGNEFHPSMVEDDIYDILDEHCVASNLYDYKTGPAIMTFLENCCLDYSMIENPLPDLSGASLSVCWIEDGYLHHIVVDLTYKEEAL